MFSWARTGVTVARPDTTPIPNSATIVFLYG